MTIYKSRQVILRQKGNIMRQFKLIPYLLGLATAAIIDFGIIYFVMHLIQTR